MLLAHLKSAVTAGLVATTLLLGGCADGVGLLSSSGTGKDVERVNALLRPHDRVYRPDGEGPFPTVLLFHGCSGPTPAHEKMWADFFVGHQFAVLAVDSHTGRNIAVSGHEKPGTIDWQEVCDLNLLTGDERAGDIVASIDHARSLSFVDSDNLVAVGFSHGAFSIWQTLVQASQEKAPVGFSEWPASGVHGLKSAILFYGPCLKDWSVNVPTLALMAEADQYIDEAMCVDFSVRNAKRTVPFAYHIFSGATHTFDHEKPNPSNVAAGSRYDEKATRKSQDLILGHISAHIRP